MYFRVRMESEEWCGFGTQRVFEAENEDAVFESHEYQRMFDEEQDLIQGHCSEEDYEENEFADAVLVDIEEIDAATYAEEVEWNDDYAAPQPDEAQRFNARSKWYDEPEPVIYKIDTSKWKKPDDK